MSFDKFQGTQDYIVSAELRDAVNVAISLERPLLIRGEPGTGKTLLSKSIAKALEKPIVSWHVKSTTRAQEGLYIYDTVQRLNDSRFGGGDVDNVEHYIKLGPLGQAFDAKERVILLIDEIDKADIEFPNDLLNELDEMSFRVRETGRLVKAVERPIIIITSNAEKELPDAFLRRCIFHYISFPSSEMMKEIIHVHFPKIEDELMTQALLKFYWLREQPEVRKKPSTSELMDWLGALQRAGMSAANLQGKFPFLGVLLKKEADLVGIEKRVN